MNSISTETPTAIPVEGPERLPELPASCMCAKVGRDLTWHAQDSNCESIVDRDAELNRILRRLCAPRAKNVIVLGEPGVGKTALVEELARRIVTNQVPDALRGRRLIQTSFSRIWAHAGRSEDWAAYGKILNTVIKECSLGGFILVMEEFHLAATYEFSMSFLRPALDAGDVTIVGTAVGQGFYNYLESDRATLRRFDVVRLSEPSREKTLEILTGIGMKWQAEAACDLPDRKTLELLVSLADKYVAHQAQPGKAIGLFEKAVEHRNVRGGSGSITDRDVRQAIAETVGIDVELMNPTANRLWAMETVLNSRVLGQEQAIGKLCRRLHVSQSHLSVTPERPAGVFLAIGPTGTGKSLMGKELAKFVTGDEKNLIQLDMNSFVTRDSALAITGVAGEQSTERRQFMPPLTRQLKQRPYSVLLLDEIEKAHPAVLLLFLQAIDSGRFVDNLGNEASLRGCIVLMTSNVGHGVSAERRPVGMVTAERDSNAEALRAVKELFPKEFLGRIDQILVFRPLTRDIMIRFVTARIQTLQRLSGKELLVTKNALELLCDRGFHAEYGARELNRTIDEMVGYPLAVLKHSDSWERATKITIDTVDDGDSLVARPSGDD